MGKCELCGGWVVLACEEGKIKFPQSKSVSSGITLRADVSWRRIGALNDRYDWIAKTMGVTFMDPNSWLVDWDCERDGLHINRRGARWLSQVYSRVGALEGRGKKVDWHLMLNSSNDGKYERKRKTSTRENSTLTSKTTENVEGTTNPVSRVLDFFKWGRRGPGRVTTDRG